MGNFAWGALARLGLARAYALDAAKDPAVRDEARAAYQNFLTLWKDADPDVPILIQAKTEYEKLQSRQNSKIANWEAERILDLRVKQERWPQTGSGNLVQEVGQYFTNGFISSGRMTPYPVLLKKSTRSRLQGRNADYTAKWIP